MFTPPPPVFALCVCVCVCFRATACLFAVADLVQKLLLMMIDAVGNTFLILLLVLYLLFEQASHPVGTLRRTCPSAALLIACAVCVCVCGSETCQFPNTVVGMGVAKQPLAVHIACTFRGLGWLNGISDTLMGLHLPFVFARDSHT